MTILFLDDDQKRIHAFYWANKDAHTLRIAYTAQHAIAFLQYEPFDLVSLDHDLEPQHYESLEADHTGTGMEVAHWIAANGRERVSRVIVHSWNPWQAAKMERTLCEAGVPCVRKEFDPTDCAVGLEEGKG